MIYDEFLESVTCGMKVILSRKGFDSSFGGYPSIILPNGRYVSFSIPGDEDELRYKDVRTADGYPMDKLMKQLFSKVYYYEWKEFHGSTNCHQDPDLVYEALPRMNGWKGCFGQADAAQTVLEKQNIKKDDLFLFFGWFKHCDMEKGSHRYAGNDDMQCIYGYLQIEEIIHTHQREELPPWLEYHPHALKRRLQRKSNCIYVARETLSWDSSRKGYGLLRYNDLTRLTKPGYTRSRWQLPEILRNTNITYHSANSWKDNYFQSACRGQEFVFDETREAEEWARNIICSGI